MMSKYENAKILRPFLILFLPGAIVLGYIMQEFLAASLWVLIHAFIGWYLRCKKCGMSIFFDKQWPIKTLLAIPKSKCTVCDKIFD
jgi:hypothetical protein